jgi:hypothetical protein
VEGIDRLHSADGNRARYRMEKTVITCLTALALMTISLVCAAPSKPP